jgi:transglutaminase-like putative cysteine protease
MTKSRFLFLIVAVFSTTTVSSQYFPVALIPDSLKNSAYLIVRDEKREVKMKSENSSVEKIIKIVTVLNKAGEDMASLALPYDENSSITINDIIYYDLNGKKIKSVKQSEISDSPAYGSSLLFSDNRVKYFKPGQPVYPYTIKFDYEINYNKIISFACWRPFSKYNVATQHSLFTIEYPQKTKINRKESNVSLKSSIKVSDMIVDTWELSNLKAIEDEPFDISLLERIPSVYLMPSVLNYGKYVGDADNWSDYGKWIYTLYQGRDEISDVEKPKIDGIVKNVTDTLARIKLLYKYMQENTRYVAIKMDLGGLQPFDAKTVFETGYGDCKALSNYMFSLLKLIGVRSYPAIVSSGTYKEPIFLGFPNFQQFDHVILCVPHLHDTIWLECTNQKIPFGFLGDFTDDRDVLLITENGGTFAHTRKYDANDNIKSNKSEFNIDSDGTATYMSKTVYNGLQYDDISELLSSNYDEQKKWLYTNSALPSLQITNFSISEYKRELPAAVLVELGISKNYCSITDKYLIMPLNTVNSQKSIQKMLKTRHSDILINRSSIDYDTLVYNIPKNYQFESIPESINITSQFGNYSCTINGSASRIEFIRKFTLFEGRYKPSLYKNLYDFVLAISKADNTKILLTRKI